MLCSMETMEDVTRRITLERLHIYNGHREKTAKSLGIGVRTLGMWLSKWKQSGDYEHKEQQMSRYIRAREDIALIVDDRRMTIKKGAIGMFIEAKSVPNFAMKEDSYRFRKGDVSGVNEGEDHFTIEASSLQIYINNGAIETNVQVGTGEINQKTDKPPMIRLDLTTETWREYQWLDPATGQGISHRILNPLAVYFYKGCTTHRVVYTGENGKEEAVVVPAPGYFGCTIHWQTKDGTPIVSC